MHREVARDSLPHGVKPVPPNPTRINRANQSAGPQFCKNLHTFPICAAGFAHRLVLRLRKNDGRKEFRVEVSICLVWKVDCRKSLAVIGPAYF